MIKKVLKGIGITIVIALLLVLGFFWKDANLDKYDNAIDDVLIPKFTEVKLPFLHQYNSEKSLPLAPSALIDIDNDGVDEVFFGGGLNQNDGLFQFKNNEFVAISFPEKASTLTSTGVATADFDKNGFVDLVVSREDGLYLFLNENGKFAAKKINTPINSKSTPAGITLGDIDKDGDIDIFLSTYIKKELMEGQTIFEDKNYGSTSALLINNGDNTFKNKTLQAGLDYVHNTFMAVLVDMDNDTWLDLIVAHDTGEVRTYKNNGNGTFTMKKNPTTNKFAYPMGIAVGDYNNDGLVDFMFSNTGSTLPRFMAKGDIKDASKFNEKWILFRNDGNFKFTDVAGEAQIANYEFSWGAVFADMNNDGLQDLMVAENYVDFLPNKLCRLSGRMLIQKENHTFVATEKKSGVVDSNLGMVPLVSDFNKDGYLDFIWTNINSSSLAYLNQGGKSNFIQVKLEKNATTIGSKVQVTTASGKYMCQDLITGEGLASDQTGTLHFGLANEKTVKKVTVLYPDGTEESIENPAINTILEIKKATIK